LETAMDKIVLEEHFVIPDFLDYLANGFTGSL
jgi:hypothetical protein